MPWGIHVALDFKNNIRYILYRINDRGRIMIKVFVDVDGTTHSTEISPETYTFLRDGANLRNRPLQFFLYRVVKEYGSLTEENILKFMDEKWVL